MSPSDQEGHRRMDSIDPFGFGRLAIGIASPNSIGLGFSIHILRYVEAKIQRALSLVH